MRGFAACVNLALKGSDLLLKFLNDFPLIWLLRRASWLSRNLVLL